MQVHVHTDAGEFARLARPLLDRDPVRHTSVLTVLHGVLGGRFAPAAMLTAHEDGAVVGALLRTDGRPALVSAVPPRCAGAVDAALAGADPDAVELLGPVDAVDPVAAARRARTGERGEVTVSMRLFALDGLVAPVGVPGAGRRVAAGDPALDVLGAWRRAFEVEVEVEARATGPGPGTGRADVERALALGDAELLWEDGGGPVAQASARAVTAGMSRIGPVYTAPAHRGRGYGAAVTAAASRWALDAGAAHVVLYTDLADPVANRLYPRLGYRPVGDVREVRFG